MTVQLIHGNCLEVLPTLPDCSVDSIVTDPPYELGFMGKKWDASGIAYDVTLWQECLRVLKPGGHLLAFGGTRTYHRMACAIEDAGFEVRDSIHWLYGSGFPKSLNVSKAIDKAAGAPVKQGKAFKVAGEYGNRELRDPETQGADRDTMRHIAVTDEARRWAGWGTALKPAHEPIVVARKPLEGTVAANVLKYGTGAINIDATRIAGVPRSVPQPKFGVAQGIYEFGAGEGRNGTMSDASGRWPANIIIDDTIANSHDDWPRYFYCAKPSRRERNTGLDHLEQKTAGQATDRQDGSAGLNSPRAGAGRTGGAQNHHPTVKPLALMRYLVRLVTPPDGTILEPFAGSGTTLMAATLERFHAIGIEMTDEYLPIIEGRVAWAEQQTTTQQKELEL